MKATLCPPRETWQRFILGRLDHQTVNELGEHLACCEPCLSVVEGLEASDNTVASEVAMMVGVGTIQHRGMKDPAIVSSDLVAVG